MSVSPGARPLLADSNLSLGLRLVGLLLTGSNLKAPIIRRGALAAFYERIGLQWFLISLLVNYKHIGMKIHPRAVHLRS